MNESVPAGQFHMVRVTNTNPFVITDMYDGVPFQFLPGKPLTIPRDVAEHIFGYAGDLADRETMRRHTQKRMGWNKPGDLQMDGSGKTLADRQFDAIRFDSARFELREVDPNADPTTPIAAQADDPEELERATEERERANAKWATDVPGSTRGGRTRRHTRTPRTRKPKVSPVPEGALG